MQAEESVGERVLRGAGHGVQMAIAYFLLGFVFWMFRGRSLSEVTLGMATSILTVYVLGAGLAGAGVGLVRPFLTTLPRVLVAYSLAMVPLAIGVNALFFERPDLVHTDPAARVAVIAVFLGVIFGTAYWKRDWDGRYPALD